MNSSAPMHFLLVPFRSKVASCFQPSAFMQFQRLTQDPKSIPRNQFCTSQYCLSLYESQKSSIKSLYHKNIGMLDLHKQSEAEVFVKKLKVKERKRLFTELQKYHDMSNNGNSANSTVTKDQLKSLFLFNCTPFIGFGFLDNAIMILAGDFIDYKIGLTLGISTMAAAALGNLISDLFGIGLAGYVELVCSKLGLPVPDLTSEQMEQTSSRVYSHLGKAVGITIGCIIGMFPLLLIDSKPEKNSQTEN